MSTLLSDLFADANGVDLTAHTMDVGGGWTQDGTFTGAVLVQSNRARLPGGTGVVAADAGAADYTATLDAVLGPTSGDDPVEVGFVFRYLSGDDFWLARIAGSPNGGVNAEVYERVAGGFTLRDQHAVTITYGNTYALQIDVSGTSVSLKLGGVEKAAYASMATGAGRTKVGIWGRDANGSGAFDADNFLVAAAGGGGLSIPVVQHHLREMGIAG